MARCSALLLVLAVSARAHADGSSIEKHARAVFEAQVTAARSSPQAFIATLSPDAVILGNGSFALASGSAAPQVIATLMRRPVSQSAIVRVDAGGSGEMMWFSADATFMDANGCGQTDARFVELAVAEKASWRVVAVSFTSTSGTSAVGDILAAPGSGPLTTYLGSFPKLVDALNDSGATAVAISETAQLGDVALGRDDARRAFAPLRHRSSSVTGAIEVHGKGWGFAAGTLVIGADPHVGGDHPVHAQLLLVAMPDGQRWSVVAIHVMKLVASTSRPPCQQGPTTSTPLERTTIDP